MSTARFSLMAGRLAGSPGAGLAAGAGATAARRARSRPGPAAPAPCTVNDSAHDGGDMRSLVRGDRARCRLGREGDRVANFVGVLKAAAAHAHLQARGARVPSPARGGGCSCHVKHAAAGCARSSKLVAAAAALATPRLCSRGAAAIRGGGGPAGGGCWVFATAQGRHCRAK